jgi:hypothetical protein
VSERLALDEQAVSKLKKDQMIIKYRFSKAGAKIKAKPASTLIL